MKKIGQKTVTRVEPEGPPEERTANRFHLLAKDAARVGNLVRSLLEQRETGVSDPSGNMRSAVMTAAIVIYARSFLNNWNSKGQADPKADITLLPMSTDLRLMELHRRIIDARDKMIAHSDWDKRQSRVIDRFDSEGSRSGGVLRQSTGAEGWEGIFERDLLDLANTVWDQARQLASCLDRGVGAQALDMRPSDECPKPVD